MEKNKSVFDVLNAIDCSKHVEKKEIKKGTQLSYLSWAWAWGICKKYYPNAEYGVAKNELETVIQKSRIVITEKETPYGKKQQKEVVWEGQMCGALPVGALYHTDGRTCWVETFITIEGQSYTEFLPIMDAQNQAIPADRVDAMDVNKAIQRGLTKALGRHGLGLYIYAGEDLPEPVIDNSTEEAKQAISAANNLDELSAIWSKFQPTMNASASARNEITAALTKRKMELTA